MNEPEQGQAKIYNGLDSEEIDQLQAQKKLTFVGPLMSVAELMRVVRAGEEGGMAAALEAAYPQSAGRGYFTEETKTEGEK